MIRAMIKNTFLSFVAEDKDGSGEDRGRSRSAECLPFVSISGSRSGSQIFAAGSRDESRDAAKQALTQQSLEKLSAVLSIGASSQETEAPFEPQVEVTTLPAECPKTLNGSFCLAAESGGQPGACVAKMPQVSSSNSLSTMAPDDVSECAELRSTGPGFGRMANGHGLSRMPHVLSSGSVCTMISDDASENSELPSVGMKRMPHVLSSGSVCTMISDDASENSELPSASMKRMPKVWSSGSVCSMVSDFDESIPEASEAGWDVSLHGFHWDGHVGAKVPPTARGRRAAARSVVTEEMNHRQVPKRYNLTEATREPHEDGLPTTMMIRNIPGRYTQEHLMSDLKDLGFGGTYDFLYMPIDQGTAANVGYAFVNFVDPAWAAYCQQTFENFRFQRHRRSSQKLARVSVAHLQGLEKNLRHYERAAVNTAKEKQRRPVVLANISTMFD